MNKKIAAFVAGAAILLATVPAFAKVETVPGPWDVNGNYVIDLTYLGVHYTEYLELQQNGDNITGTSLALAGNASPWTIESGSVVDNTVNFLAHFNANPSLHATFTATIDPDGSMNGNWEDVDPGTRDGTWETTDGNATRFEGNHGQYVSSQEDKQGASQSRVGMPVQSQGHTE